MTVDTLTSSIAVSVGSDFTCALDNDCTAHCWGNKSKGRLGSGGNTTYTTPNVVNTSTTFASIESGNSHTCALTSTGVMECWGDNTFAQMAETPWDGSSGTKSKKSPDIVYNLGSSTTFSKVSTGAESFFTADLIDNGSIAVWGTCSRTEYENHFVLNNGAATDVAAGTNHLCYLESGAVTCVGDNSAGQTTVPSLTDPQSVYAGANWSCAGLNDGSYTCWGSKASW